MLIVLSKLNKINFRPQYDIFKLILARIKLLEYSYKHNFNNTEMPRINLDSGRTWMS